MRKKQTHKKKKRQKDKQKKHKQKKKKRQMDKKKRKQPTKRKRRKKTKTDIQLRKIIDGQNNLCLLISNHKKTKWVKSLYWGKINAIAAE